ncbi:MAG: Uma2 family endonuclease [Chloroflexi bacterium]|nr:Uma2 family endonuclease [Chloroflexota bacterium]
MMLKRTRRGWTYRDYCAIPDDGQRYEVIWGELYVAPSPSRGHQRSAGKLFTILDRHVTEHGLGEVYIAPFDVVLDEENVVQPDLLFVSKERLDIITEANIRGAPDLVVEVLSRSTAALDRSQKWDLYAAAGVPHYWLVDPVAHTLEAYIREGGDYRLADRRTHHEVFSPALFPGLDIPLASVW